MGIGFSEAGRRSASAGLCLCFEGVMRLRTFSIVTLVFALALANGCGGAGEKGKYKDADRPRATPR